MSAFLGGPVCYNLFRYAHIQHYYAINGKHFITLAGEIFFLKIAVDTKSRFARMAAQQKGMRMNDMVNYIKLANKETEEIIGRYKVAVCWLALSALLNVAMLMFWLFQ